MTDLRSRLESHLGSRYQLARELGAGGMATVFLATDTKHDRQVALKVLRPEVADAIGAERFLREIDTVARLSHPHILPLYDSGKAGGLLYYVMPYVEGESLRARIEREGALPIEDALQIARECADGLAHAHEHGVMHRDIKPANVLLSGGHAVLADFGIARALEEAVDRETLTRTGVSIGTVGYMSPEQAAGEKKLDARTDVYALGLVLYEMLAGEPAFRGPTARAVMARQVSEGPPSVSTVRNTVPAALERVVEKACRVTPGDRYATAAQLGESLRRVKSRGESAPGEGRPNMGRIAAAGGALILAIAGGAFLAQRDDVQSLEKNRVVVDAFENRTGDPQLDAVGTMAAHWLVRTLQSMPDIEVVPLTSTLAVGAGAEDRSTRLDLFAAEFGARVMITGSYYLEGDSLRIVANVTDAAEHEILHSTDPISAPRPRPSEGLEALQQNLAGFIAVWGGSAHGTASLMRPPSYEAYQEFATGLGLFVRGDFSAALPYFDRGIALDSTYVPAIMYGAVSLSNLGRRAEVEPYLARLERMRNRLTPFEAIHLEWLTADYNRDRGAMLRAARRAADLVPSPATWRYLVGLHAVQLNRPIEAIEALDQIDASSRLAREWRPYWVVLASALHLTERYQDELAVLRTARELHPEHPGLLAREIAALAAEGRLDDAVRRIDEIYLLSPDAGLSTGAALRLAAQELRVHGPVDAARDAADRAVEWYDARPEAPDGAGDPAGLAWALLTAGRYEEARPLLEKLVSESPEGIDGLGQLGVVAARLGDRAGADRADARLAALASTSPWATFQRGRVAAALGERDRAVSLLRRAFRGGHPMSTAVHCDPELLDLRGFPPFDELMEPKG